MSVATSTCSSDRLQIYRNKHVTPKGETVNTGSKSKIHMLYQQQQPHSGC